MNPVCVAVYDKKSETFLAPVFNSDLATAERSFIALFQRYDTTIAQWPEDYDLYHLGNYDPRSGALLSLDHPSLVITGQSALLALSRMRRQGGELSGGSKLTPPEDSSASAERNKTPFDGLKPAVDTAPAQ